MMTDENSRPSAYNSLLLKIIGIIILLIVVTPLIWLFLLSPRSEITKLKDHFVKVKFDEKVQYQFIKKKPEAWVPLSLISENASNAIIISEDWGFFDHKGVDFNQIKKAVQDAGEGKKLRGASTISQQLIKNLFLSSERSYIRKVKEFALVSHLEQNVSKEKILETYLNIIEFGEGIYGIGAAAKHYFNKRPSQLTPKEGAFLAMLLPNPKKYSSSFRDKKLTPFAKETMDEILHKMAVAGHIKKEDVERYKAQELKWRKELSQPGKEVKERSNFRKKKSGTKRAKLKKPKSYEDRYRNDKDLELDDNLEYDDDAILEDTSGLKEEFSVE